MEKRGVLSNFFDTDLRFLNKKNHTPLWNRVSIK
jgi:hypothetical protein